jgi:acyl carrier protein
VGNDLSWDDFCVAVVDGLQELDTSPPPEGLGPHHHLMDDLGLDSFGVFVLAGELELRLGRPVPSSEAEPTVGNLYRLLAGAALVGGDARG